MTELAVWTGEQVDLLKRTIAQGCTDDEFALFAQVARRAGLDPFARQIYAVRRNNRMTIQTGIDGYRLIADRTGKYAGNDDAVFTGGGTYPAMATVTVWKLVAGQRCPFTATARWSEYYPGDGGQGTMWRNMPHTMLAKCAEALALRKAFPADLSGIYTSEEMDQADPPAAPAPALEQPDPLAARRAAILEQINALTEPDRDQLAEWCKADRLSLKHGGPVELEAMELMIRNLRAAAMADDPSLAREVTYQADKADKKATRNALEDAARYDTTPLDLAHRAGLTGTEPEG